ncbi:MAG: DsrH/TusB family sulfur metabolism protein [Promethearchaeota archaeon]|jgi:sulfur relay protein TusB/DsrH
MTENISIVYLYGFSTMLESKLTNLITIIEHQIKLNIQISVVFIHDGVIGTSQKNNSSSLMQKLLALPIAAYSMIPDLKARGIDTINLHQNIKGIEYDDLVDILANTPKIVSWM